MTGDMILYAMATGFAANFGLMLIFWNTMNKQFDSLGNRLDKLDEKLTDVDRRLCRLEGAFASKDCCVIKESHKEKAN